MSLYYSERSPSLHQFRSKRVASHWGLDVTEHFQWGTWKITESRARRAVKKKFPTSGVKLPSETQVECPSWRPVAGLEEITDSKYQ